MKIFGYGAIYKKVPFFLSFSGNSDSAFWNSGNLVVIVCTFVRDCGKRLRPSLLYELCFKFMIACAEGWKSATVIQEKRSRSDATDLDMNEAGGLKR